VIVGKPPRKLASTFRPDSGHFSVQNAAPSVACMGVVTVKTNKDGIDAPLLTPKKRLTLGCFIILPKFSILEKKGTKGSNARGGILAPYAVSYIKLRAVNRKSSQSIFHQKWLIPNSVNLL